MAFGLTKQIRNDRNAFISLKSCCSARCLDDIEAIALPFASAVYGRRSLMFEEDSESEYEDHSESWAIFKLCKCRWN